jgi:A/G-specific adenine glycosylase
LSQGGVKEFFGRELLAWYRREKRDLPWRRNRDPYQIWVSEIMLQQTRVETVIPYYHRFMDRFPTIGDLAAAPEEDVLKAWEGLGYYSRARNLQTAARQVTTEHGGVVPRDKASIAALKGVGPYTAGAILSIAFDQPEPAVDGNVMRVLSRYFNLDDDIARPSVRVGMEKLAQELIPLGEAASFNQALMELGALVCTPRNPGCLSCPVMEHCAGRLAGRERELPVKTKAKPPKPVYRLAVLIEGTGEAAGRVLVRQRPAEGLLARMWELPHVEAPNEAVWASDESASGWMSGALAAEGISVRPIRHVADAEHIFTHLHWFVRIWNAEWTEGQDLGPEYRWADRADLELLAWPNVFRRLLGEYFKA